MPDQTNDQANATPANGGKPAERLDGGEPAQEWGGRQETGKAIARGGKTDGEVAGAGGGQQPSASDANR